MPFSFNASPIVRRLDGGIFEPLRMLALSMAPFGRKPGLMLLMA